jgi:hypothetical protein
MAPRACLLVLLLTTSVRASECAPIKGGVPELGKVDAEVRLRFLRDRLRYAARRTRIWSYTWTGIYSTLMVGQLALMDPHDRNSLIDNGIGAGASLIGVLSIALIPQSVMSDQWWLERRLKHAKPGTDVCALLAEAEGLLIRDAKSSAFGKSPLTHAGNFAINIGLGFVLGFGFGHWNQAAIQGLTGIAVGEIMIISQPNDTVNDLRRYRAANLGLPPTWRSVSWGIAPMLGQNRAGLMVGFGF